MKKSLIKLGVILAITLSFSSCAYYNTFYNAKNSFKSAQSKALTVKGKPSSAAIEEYNKVIKKCGIVLTDYKDSKWADDALFLLAKALFFRGNNELQSQEKFNDLIKFYPDSEFVPESKLFLAQIAYNLNKKEDSFKMFQEFIQNPKYKKDHPKALVLISDYYIKEKKYIDAQFYLRLIIEKYSDSKDYPNAFFLLGKTLYDNQDYVNSLKVFEELASSKIDRRIKLDAQYYTAYNYYNLNKFSEAEKLLKKLNKLEYREDKLPFIEVLNGRNIAEIKSPELAITALEKTITKYPRTIFSAEASYWIAELYFSELHNYEKAIEFYNKVKSENSASEFIQKAVTRSAIASQIIQIQNPNRELLLEDLINEQFKLAEYYLYELNLPDSAIYIYDKMPAQKARLENIFSSMKSKKVSVDSLVSVKSDTLLFDQKLVQFNEMYRDSLKLNPVYADSSRKMLADSVFTKFDKLYKQTESDITQYDNRFIPNSIFIKLIIQDAEYKNDTEVMNLIKELNSKYPENRYTVAANDYLNKREVDFLTIEEKNQLATYEKAMNIIADSVNVSLDLLKGISESDNKELSQKAKFTIGFTYYVELKDSLNAKPFLNEVLLKDPQSEYATYIKNFYDGTNFKIIDVLPAIIDLEKFEKEQKEALLRKAIEDSLRADSTKIDSTKTEEMLNPDKKDEDPKHKKDKTKKIKPKKPKDNSLNSRYIIKPRDFYYLPDRGYQII